MRCYVANNPQYYVHNCKKQAAVRLDNRYSTVLDYVLSDAQVCGQ